MGRSGGGSVGSGSGGAGKPGIREFGERVVGARTDGNSPLMAKKKKGFVFCCVVFSVFFFFVFVLFRNEKNALCVVFFLSGKCRWGILQFRGSLGPDFFKDVQVTVVSAEYLTSLHCGGQEWSILFKNVDDSITQLLASISLSHLRCERSASRRRAVPPHILNVFNLARHGAAGCRREVMPQARQVSGTN